MKIKRNTLLLLLILIISLFSGCSSSLNSVKNKVNAMFLTEEELKVGVKSAYITKKLDAKSKIVQEVKFNEKLRVIGLKDNENWFKVLSKDKEGFIPRNSMIEITVANSFGKSLSKLWKVVKSDDTNLNTTFDAKNKKWTDSERERSHNKGFAKGTQKRKNNDIKMRYNNKYMNRYFASLSEEMTKKTIKNFRQQGRLK